MNLSYPHREALVVRGHELRVIRRLTGGPDIKVRAGERIGPEHVLARTDPGAFAVRIPIAEQLGVSPQEVGKLLMRPIGSSFAAGEAMARTRKGLRNVVVAAPAAGVLLGIDPATGVASLAPGSAGEIRALVPGDVEFVESRESVSIRTVGARLLGVVGLGTPARGALKVVVVKPEDEIGVTKVTPDLAGKIVVGGSWISAAALKKLGEVGAAGVVVGGIIEKELVAGIGASPEDRLSPWRPSSLERTIGDGLAVAFPLLATEGFGQLPMHPEAFALLKECEGQDAVLLPGTRVGGRLLRPELIVPNAALLDDDGLTSQALFVTGAKVRLTDQARLGKSGVLLSSPRRSRRGDGQSVDVVDIELANQQHVTAPIGNVEIVA